jgi:hypothetical protein
MKMEQCSETSAYKIQIAGELPIKNIQEPGIFLGGLKTAGA